jgi:hypothetical protein
VITRALLALNHRTGQGSNPPHGLCAALSGYALDLATEIETRATRGS